MSPAASSPDDRANGAVAASASTDVTKAIEVPVSPPSPACSHTPGAELAVLSPTRRCVRPVDPQPLHLIHAEVLAVTSAMRKNQRWASAASTSYPYVTGSSRLNGSQAIGGAGISNRRSNLRSRPDEAHISKQGRSLGLMGGFSELRLMLRDMQGARAEQDLQYSLETVPTEPSVLQIPPNWMQLPFCTRSSRSSVRQRRRARSRRQPWLPSTNSSPTRSCPRPRRISRLRWCNFRLREHTANSKPATPSRTRSSCCASSTCCGPS